MYKEDVYIINVHHIIDKIKIFFSTPIQIAFRKESILTTGCSTRPEFAERSGPNLGLEPL
jgi:hypothetical protein